MSTISSWLGSSTSRCSDEEQLRHRQAPYGAPRQTGNVFWRRRCEPTACPKKHVSSAKFLFPFVGLKLRMASATSVRTDGVHRYLVGSADSRSWKPCPKTASRVLLDTTVKCSFARKRFKVTMDSVFSCSHIGRRAIPLVFIPVTSRAHLIMRGWNMALNDLAKPSSDTRPE